MIFVFIQLYRTVFDRRNKIEIENFIARVKSRIKFAVIIPIEFVYLRNLLNALHTSLNYLICQNLFGVIQTCKLRCNKCKYCSINYYFSAALYKQHNRTIN